MAVKVGWQQALAWRMQRHLLDPVGRLPVAGVVGRLCGVQTQVASSAELAVRVRRETSRSGEVGRALAEGRLIKTWAMRGALHLVTPEEGGAFLSLLAAGRSWERPSWQRYFGMTTELLDVLRRAVREALDSGPLTREELVAASSRWAGVPEPDEAAPAAIVAYLGAYGPATFDNFRNWLSRGRIGTRQLRTWFSALGDRLAEVKVDGERAYVLAEHLGELASARPTTAVRLLPGFDQYVLGPGTEDGNVVPAKRRAAVSKQSGWISPVVVAGGVVRRTWGLDGDRARVAWFREAGKPPRNALEAQVARLSSILDRDLRAAINLA